MDPSYELLLIAQVAFFICELRVTVYYTIYELLLTLSYDKDKDDKDVVVMMLWQNITLWDHFLIMNLVFAKPRLDDINI